MRDQSLSKLWPSRSITLLACASQSDGFFGCLEGSKVLCDVRGVGAEEPVTGVMFSSVSVSDCVVFGDRIRLVGSADVPLCLFLMASIKSLSGRW